MKRIIAVMAAVLMLGQSPCLAQGIPKDKAQHIGACYAADMLLSTMKPFSKWKPWQRALFTTAVIGGGKEWYDSRHPDHHSASWGDIGADAVGAFAAEGTIWIIHKTW